MCPAALWGVKLKKHFYHCNNIWVQIWNPMLHLCDLPGTSGHTPSGPLSLPVLHVSTHDHVASHHVSPCASFLQNIWPWTPGDDHLSDKTTVLSVWSGLAPSTSEQWLLLLNLHICKLQTQSTRMSLYVCIHIAWPLICKIHADSPVPSTNFGTCICKPPHMPSCTYTCMKNTCGNIQAHTNMGSHTYRLS